MKAAAVIAALLVILGGAFCIFRFRTPAPPGESAAPSPMFRRVELKTGDNVSIIGDYYAPASTSAKGLLLLHMMPATRASWRAFAAKMRNAGWHVLAIDLRGHGESQGGPNGYNSFSDAEHQTSRYDVEAGAGFLESKGVSDLALGGASIGANLALQYLADPPAGGLEAKAAFLLSPGLDYRGVKTESAARNLKPGQAVYYIASLDDQYSAETIQALFDAVPAGVGKEIKLFEAAGHGTAVFEKEPGFMDELASRLKNL